MTRNTHPRYKELPPPRALADRLLCLWTRQVGDGEARSCVVLPDGCVDIVYIGDSVPLVAGPATRTTRVDLAAGITVIGARFRPGWAADSLGVTASELLDQYVPLAELSGVIAERFTEPVFRYDTPGERLQELTAALQERYAARPPVDPVIRACVEWLLQYPAGRLRDLAQQAGTSERQLHRRFCAAVGYAPKTFQRIMRLQRLRWMHSQPEGTPTLAMLAQHAGYTDQSHMCREIAALSGRTPRKLLVDNAATLSLSDLFNTDTCT